MTKLPVVAVIPAYNAAKTLPDLLNELITQDYDLIYVLDDSSSDGTVKVAKSFGSKVKVIEGRENVGSGANRNRIIGQTKDCYVHFLDADVRLLSKNTPEIIRGLKWADDTAYYGGMLRNPAGEQNPYNFGPRASAITTITSTFQYLIWMLSRRNWRLAKFLNVVFRPITRSWPNIFQPPRATQTFWTAESNMIIRSKTFTDFGGYDPRFRYGEINDLALRFEAAGFKTYFTPGIDVIHASVDNIFAHREDKWQSHRQLLDKYGWLVFWAPSLWKRFGKKRVVK